MDLALAIIFMCFGAISLVAFLLQKVKKYTLIETFTKTITSMFFIAVAGVGLFKNGQYVLAKLVIFGLFCGLLGDIALELKYVYPKDDKLYSYAGFILFAMGHVFFMLGLYLNYFKGNNPLYIIIPLVVGLLVSVVNILMEKPMKLHYGELKIISLVYGFFLFSFIGTAFSMFLLNGFKDITIALILGGAVLFAISDLVLSGTYFGKGKDRPVDLVVNSVLYYIAQNLIAFSLFLI